MNKKSNLIFLGGIHGVGKGTFCKKICDQIGWIHLTASEILKWKEISSSNNKKVVNVQETQDRLIIGLNNLINDKDSFLLDGHFCLLNAQNDITRVPLDTFIEISPRMIIILTERVELIKQRLEKRDSISYNFYELENMQNLEIEYAIEIAEKLNVPFLECKSDDFQKLIDVIQ